MRCGTAATLGVCNGVGFGKGEKQPAYQKCGNPIIFEVLPKPHVAMALPTLLPIQDQDLPEFCRFLTENLSRERSAEAWAQAFRQPWCRDKPNNGFLLRQEGRVVGGIGAIYADRTIRGQDYRFCNITSWCVQDAFRSQSMRLAMAVTSQPGLQFTDLTPTEVVSKTLQFLKFKPMDERHAIFPNRPAAPSLARWRQNRH